jgi:hypothetical protein
MGKDARKDLPSIPPAPPRPVPTPRTEHTAR